VLQLQRGILILELPQMALDPVPMHRILVGLMDEDTIGLASEQGKKRR